MVYLLIVCMKLITYNNYLEGVDFEPLLNSFILSCSIERPGGGYCLYRERVKLCVGIIRMFKLGKYNLEEVAKWLISTAFTLFFFFFFEHQPLLLKSTNNIFLTIV